MVLKKFNLDTIRYMGLFENMTKVSANDCFVCNGTIFFFVEAGKVGLCVGRQGANIHNLRNALGKDIRVMGSFNNAAQLVMNFLYPIVPAEVTEESEIITIKLVKPMQRRRLLNNQQAELKLLLGLIQNYFPNVREIKVP